MVPPAISRLYTPEVLSRLARIQRPPFPREDAAADSVRQRHIIFSGQELPGHALQVRRAAWWSYLEHAAAVGLLDEEDLRRRLVDVDDENFRGGLAECMVSWFFVVHDPFAAKPLPLAVFGDRRQLVAREAGEMTWVGQLGG